VTPLKPVIANSCAVSCAFIFIVFVCVHEQDSTIDTADDGVCIKGSTVGGVSINVTVRNIRVRSRSSAIKYGSNCPIPMSGHLFEDIEIFDSNRGLALQVLMAPCLLP